METILITIAICAPLSLGAGAYLWYRFGTTLRADVQKVRTAVSGK
jgi:hypothetical protein